MQLLTHLQPLVRAPAVCMWREGENFILQISPAVSVQLQSIPFKMKMPLGGLRGASHSH